ncbi:MAG: ATP-binding protein, partial [Planctomycetota bacterium]
IIGRFGSGKTFFLQLVRNLAQHRRFVVAAADITTERRFQGSGGQARGLYSEQMRNLSTRSKPQGNAISSVLERWIGDLDHEIRSTRGGSPDDVRRAFDTQLRPLQDLVSGYDFYHVVSRYYDGFVKQDDALQDAALRWLRGEYATKTQARQELDVRGIIDDSGFYDHLKLMAAFVRIAGYAGLLINIDELVVLSHRLANTRARNNNYEALLRIYNDCLQGRASGIGFLFAGTDECLEDRRRGLFSYEALATRLANHQFTDKTRVDLTSPVLRLQTLSPEDCYVLLENIRRIHAGDESEDRWIDDDGIAAFLQHCNRRLGAVAFREPRNTVRDFVGLLNQLQQNPSMTYHEFLDDAGTSPKTATPDPPNQSMSNETSEQQTPSDAVQPDFGDEDLTRFQL